MAKVNGGEISVHQVNYVIARNGSQAPEQARQSAAQALERLIDQELLVQKALEARLERDAQVVQAMQAARRQILATAYLERGAHAQATENDDAAIHKFYAENPLLFEHRRIYRVRELAVSLPPEQFDALAAAAGAAKSLDEIAAWLKSRNLRFSALQPAWPAEQVPLANLPRMHQLKAGQIAVFASPGGAAVVQMLAAEEAAVSEAQAVPLIQQFLGSLKRRELAQAEVRRLREKAKVEYFGEFAAASASSDEHIGKGVAGLR